MSDQEKVMPLDQIWDALHNFYNGWSVLSSQIDAYSVKFLPTENVLEITLVETATDFLVKAGISVTLETRNSSAFPYRLVSEIDSEDGSGIQFVMLGTAENALNWVDQYGLKLTVAGALQKAALREMISAQI